MRRGPLALCALLLFAFAVSPAMAQQSIVPGGAAGPPSRSPEVIPDQYIVELHHGASVDAVSRGHRVTPAVRFGIINGFAARMSHAVATALSRDPRVQRVSPDLVVRAYAKPSSPPGKNKNGGGSGGGGDTPTCPTPVLVTPEEIPAGVARIGAPGAWAATTGNGVKVAVIDTGIDLCHPDLAANYLAGINYVSSGQPPKDDNGHGTHVAGIIAAAQDGSGVVGVAPNAKLLVAKALDANGSGSLSTVVTAIDWAVTQGAHVINLSLGAVDFWCSALGVCGAGAECTAISNAVAKGVVVVVAAGNSADEARFYTPANCRDSLTVTALDASDTFAWFSNYSEFYWDVDGTTGLAIGDHPVVDLAAPGVNVLSTMPTYDATLTASYGKTHGRLSGTSMATPHVAGAAALYIASPASAGATADQVRQALVSRGECAGSAAPAGNIVCELGWSLDPDGVWEPLVDASSF
jgi:subtilisin family serine protease